MKVKDHGIPFAEMSFAEKAEAYVQRQFLNRRNFLHGAAMLAGAAALPAFGGSVFAQQPGGHLIVGRASGSDSLDNQKSSSISSSEVQRHIYDTLVMLDANTGKVNPSLADSWTFEDENKTVVFKLRQGVKFHDGTPFNAAAVEATVKRHLDKATASPTTFLLGPIDHVEALDDMTVAYHYKQPFVAIWAALTLVYAAPHSPEAVAKYGADFGRNPVGTGPYRFVSWDSNDVITLERNPDRNWETPLYQNSGAPYLDSVEYRTIPEPATRVAALLSQEIDILAGSGDAVPADSIDQLSNTPGVSILSQTALGATCLIPCQAVAPMDHVKVRQALGYAIDREKMVAFALNGRGKVATSPLGSAIFNYDPATADTSPKLDPEKAKSLLAEAGVGEGLELSYLGPDEASARIIAESLQADLAAVGIKLRIDSLPTAEYASLRGKDKYHLIYNNYSYADADILRQMLGMNSPLNYSRHKNQEFDDLATAQGEEFDAEKRAEEVRKMQEIVINEAIWLPLVERQIIAAAREGVTPRLSAEGTLIVPDTWKA